MAASVEAEREELGRLLGVAYRAILAELGHHRFRPMVEELYRSHIRAVAEEEGDMIREQGELVRKGMRAAGLPDGA